MPKIITLEPHELRVAEFVGRERQQSAIDKGLPDRHGHHGDGFETHVEGAAGEMAVAKALGLYWNASIDTFRRLPDIGDCVEVKTRSNPDYELLIRRDDNPAWHFVLAYGRRPTYTVVGWLIGKHGMRAEFIRNYAGRGPAFFVPTTMLEPID